MGSGINLSKKAQKTAKKSAIPTTTNRERPQRTSDAGKKHTTSWTGNGGRDRPTRGRASGRDNATRRDATERRSPETFKRERRRTDGYLCTPGPGHGPAPPPAGGGYPGRMAVTYATAGIPAWGVRWPPTLAKAA
ncbi:Hypothetical predicted protein [Pelobates cultripes]|uniref:Uncharacterized protein n=1 Tax=Pelobates cultripes TaxID=61616 RepID=A0AAD1SZ48_PELCU|nr:Hypothetical predicted protein [Pelobates cultripes]CAH2311814.1 Hypothetical predicted protein [Pelobates cultripes]